MTQSESMSDYFLQSERLRFRCWRADDMELAWSLWGDPEVTKLFSREPLTRQSVKKRLAHEIEQRNKCGIQYWPLFTLDGDFVGCCGLRPKSGSAAEIGFHLLKKHWGNGYATEAARAVVDHAFSTLKIETLFAGHHPDNKSSRSALRKLGFIGAPAEFYEPTGLHHPSYLLYKEDKPCRLRLAQQADSYALAAVHHDSLRGTFDELVPEYANSRSLDDFEHLWSGRFDDSLCVTNALVRGEQIVGLVSASAPRDDDSDGTFGEVGRIYLHPSVWQKGHGVALLAWCEEELARKGYVMSKLWVFEVNERARRFYERNGYRLDGKTKEEFATRLLRYEKKLL
jgi:ribosomal-protein-alanine N-acetyltransferase